MACASLEASRLHYDAPDSCTYRRASHGWPDGYVRRDIFPKGS